MFFWEDGELFSSFCGEPLKMLTTVDGSESGSPLDFARLFEVFPPAHFLFKTASFDQFAEPTDCFLDGLFVPND
jgi:hypothetical protein